MLPAQVQDAQLLLSARTARSAREQKTMDEDDEQTVAEAVCCKTKQICRRYCTPSNIVVLLRTYLSTA
jgi:hypothetical protein